MQASAIKADAAVDSTAGIASPAPGVASSAIAATPSSTNAIVRISANGYFVDSINGNDSWSGTAATAAVGNIGPWKTLSKLASISLKPGDSVSLACGSQWNQTLATMSSGTAQMPITISAYPANCTNPPVIDGSTAIAPSAWALYKPNIYVANLAAAPLALYSSTGNMTVAHYPNFGADPSAPNSLYLHAAADSNVVTTGGQQGSTNIVTGSDLVVPAGVSLVGATVRIRTNAWLMDQSTVASVSGKQINLTTPTLAPLQAGWGYFLMGQLWMLDSPGEWYYDPVKAQVYAWMPNSLPPSAPVLASQLATGINLASRQYITVTGISVAHVGIGADLRSSVGITLRGSSIGTTASYGVLASGSQNATIDTDTFSMTGIDAVSGVDNVLPLATGMQVLNSSISNSGVVMNGDTVVSLPVRNWAAINPGSGATVSNNSISNSGYLGTWTMAGSKVTGNTIYGTCSVLDDCGAIYVSSQNNNNTISGNLIQHSRGALAGKAPSAAFTQAQGIFLDNWASGVTVSGNTVTDTDHGIQLHIAANNTISGNILYGNRTSQLWMQETSNTINPQGDVYGNVVSGNQIVPTGTSGAYLLQSSVSNPQHFGTFSGDRFFDSILPVVAVEQGTTGTTSYTFAQWQAATSTSGATRNLETSGFAASQTRFTAISISGTNIVPNGALTTGTAGWSNWNATAPYGVMTRQSCTPGWCMRYAAGASAGLLSSPNFSITKGQWYRLALDIAAGSNGQAINLVVRNGGGGTASYEAVSDRATNFVAGTAWARYSTTFMASETVTVADPATGGLGARIDIQNVMPGQSVSVANMELVPITPADALTSSSLLTNYGRSAIQLACPAASTQPSLCSQFVQFGNLQPVTWPVYLAPLSTAVIYSRDPSLVDSDGDGIPDSQDQCPNTPAGVGVNSKGCPLGQ